MSDHFEFEQDESDQLDQLWPDPAIVDRDATESVDESYAPRDDWSEAEFGTAGVEPAEGEAFEQRLEQEAPEVEDDWDEDADESEPGPAAQ
jgi:hypothetical protein